MCHFCTTSSDDQARINEPPTVCQVRKLQAHWRVRSLSDSDVFINVKRYIDDVNCNIDDEVLSVLVQRLKQVNIVKELPVQDTLCSHDRR